MVSETRILKSEQEIDEAIKEEEEKLDKKVKLNWIEKIATRKFIKKLKKNLKKEQQKAQQNKTTEIQLKNKITEMILQLKPYFNIKIDKYNQQQQIEYRRNKKGKDEPIEVEATQETLQNMPLNKQIETLEQILEEMQKII